MMKRLLIISVLTLVAYAAGAQIYVATDKSCYVAGEQIWCSVFSASGPSVAYLELMSSEGMAACTRIDMRDGRGGGSLSLPVSAATGNYRLCAYTPGSAVSEGPLLSVFNTFTTERVPGGVQIVDSSEYGTKTAVSTGYGFSVKTDGRITLKNTSGANVSCCVSLTRDDSLQAAGFSSIAGFRPGEPARQDDGEVLYAVLDGPDAPAVESSLLEDSLAVRALIAVPGSKTDCYSGTWTGKRFEFHTENIFGATDVVCMLDGLAPGQDCHLQLVSPFGYVKVPAIPPLRLCRKQEADLLRRTGSMLNQLSRDTLSVSLPVKQEHFFLAHECVSYILDDYNRFPTMEEVFVEITPNVKLRRRAGKTQISVLMRTSVNDATPRWGKAMVMVDGVPVLDHKLIETYDPAIVKVVEVYPYKYEMHGYLFDGVVNLVTFKGNMPGVLFDDNVRIYDYHACSWPREHRGAETPYWHPLVTLAPGEEVEIPSDGLQAGVSYNLSVDGLTSNGRPVYLRKTFVR